MTKDEAFQQYEETMKKLDKEYNYAKDTARGILNLNLKAIRFQLHEELKAVRAISQRRR